jgi:hypothetical protein
MLELNDIAKMKSMQVATPLACADPHHSVGVNGDSVSDDTLATGPKALWSPTSETGDAKKAIVQTLTECLAPLTKKSHP